MGYKLTNLKKLREKKKLSQIKLSTEIELSQEIISQYELGTTLPTVTNLIKLADYFNCSLEYLLGMTNNPNRIISHFNNFFPQCYIITFILGKRYISLKR